MRKRNTGNAIILYLLSPVAAFPGKTLGEIEKAIGAPRGTATHQRLTEKRQQGFDIRCHKDGDRWRYFILRAHVRKYAALIAKQAVSGVKAFA